MAFDYPILQMGSRGEYVGKAQVRLQEAGFYSGTIDNIFGTKTLAAVRSFQSSKGLTSDGIIGPNTWAKLVEGADESMVLPPGDFTLRPIPIWMQTGFSVLQEEIREIPGIRHHPGILEMHKVTSLKAKDDETAWCASAMCYVLKNSGLPHTGSAAAASYANYGVATYPRFGAIVVWPHHVAFYLDDDGSGGAYIMGGNQRNEFCISHYSAAGMQGAKFRFPAGF